MLLNIIDGLVREMLTAAVFVSFKDNPDIVPIKLPSNVTGEDLVNVVLNKPGFGEGSVENEEGITVTKAVPSVTAQASFKELATPLDHQT